MNGSSCLCLPGWTGSDCGKGRNKFRRPQSYLFLQFTVKKGRNEGKIFIGVCQWPIQNGTVGLTNLNEIEVPLASSMRSKLLALSLRTQRMNIFILSASFQRLAMRFQLSEGTKDEITALLPNTILLL